MISAKEAKENTIAKKKELFYNMIEEAIEKGLFEISFEPGCWERAWKYLMSKELEEQGYDIFFDLGYVYITWR